VVIELSCVDKLAWAVAAVVDTVDGYVQQWWPFGAAGTSFRLRLALPKLVAFVFVCLLGEVPESWH